MLFKWRHWHCARLLKAASMTMWAMDLLDILSTMNGMFRSRSLIYLWPIIDLPVLRKCSMTKLSFWSAIRMHSYWHRIHCSKKWQRTSCNMLPQIYQIHQAVFSRQKMRIHYQMVLQHTRSVGIPILVSIWQSRGSLLHLDQGRTQTFAQRWWASL